MEEIVVAAGHAAEQGERMRAILERLSGGPPILLDGATGTELGRRGVDISLPLWSARALLDAPDVLEAVHRDYRAAGAEVLTANTFRTHPRSLRTSGHEHRAAELTRRAVEIARSAAGEEPPSGSRKKRPGPADERAWVAGSLAPLEDCYSPELVPSDGELAREHGEMAGHLAAAGVDVILVETQNTIREAVAATRAAAETGLPTWTSFVCGFDGRLLSGERLTDAVDAVLPDTPVAVLVNCVPAGSAALMLAELRHVAGDVPCGVYANTGRLDPDQGWTETEARLPRRYAALAETWLDGGARMIGGCCGTTPEHISALRSLIDARQMDGN